MRVQLLVSTESPLCRRAEKIWREVAAERGFDFSIVEMAEKEGGELAQRLHLKTIPALVVDDALVAIGVQTLEEARKIIDTVPERSG